MAQDVLQLYHTLKLCSPLLSLSAFCKAVSEAAWCSELQQVGPWHACAVCKHIHTMLPMSAQHASTARAHCARAAADWPQHVPCVAGAGANFFAADVLPLCCVVQPLRAINTNAFRRAADEFSNCQLDLRQGVQLLNDLECPACSGGSCAYHVDGNMKLFVWQRQREPWRAAHSQLFFAKDDDVQLTIQAVDCARVRTLGLPDDSSATPERTL